jgi:hypothetical protein
MKKLTIVAFFLVALMPWQLVSAEELVRLSGALARKEGDIRLLKDVVCLISVMLAPAALLFLWVLVLSPKLAALRSKQKAGNSKGQTGKIQE